MIEAFRQTETAAVIDREIKLKSRKRGLSVWEMAESLLAMWAAGSERAADLDQFRQDEALALLQEGKAPVAAETVPPSDLAKAERVLDLHAVGR